MKTNPYFRSARIPEPICRDDDRNTLPHYARDRLDHARRAGALPANPTEAAIHAVVGDRSLVAVAREYILTTLALESLCYNDPNHPGWEDVFADTPPEDIPEPRPADCYCDNCFYGRDPLATALLALLGLPDVGHPTWDRPQQEGATR